MSISKGLLIDAKRGIISEVKVGDYTDIQRLIGCDTFTVVRLSKTECLYVDDNGLINDTTHGFSIATANGQLMGNGVVLGLNPHSGDSEDTKLAIGDLAKTFGIVECFDAVTGERRALKNISSLN